MRNAHSQSQRRSPVSRQSAETHDGYFLFLAGTSKEYRISNIIKKQRTGLTENVAISMEIWSLTIKVWGSLFSHKPILVPLQFYYGYYIGYVFAYWFRHAGCPAGWSFWMTRKVARNSCCWNPVGGWDVLGCGYEPQTNFRCQNLAFPCIPY